MKARSPSTQGGPGLRHARMPRVISPDQEESPTAGRSATGRPTPAGDGMVDLLTTHSSHAEGVKAYSSRARGHGAMLRLRRIIAGIPEPADSMCHRKCQGSRGGRPVSYDFDDFKNRNVVERFIYRAWNWRGLAAATTSTQSTTEASADSCLACPYDVLGQWIGRASSSLAEPGNGRQLRPLARAVSPVRHTSTQPRRKLDTESAPRRSALGALLGVRRDQAGGT